MTQEQITFGSSATQLASTPMVGAPAVVKRIYVQPLATNTHRMFFETAGGALIKSIAAPGSGATAILDDFTLTQPGDGHGYIAQEYAVAGTSGEGCVVTYWPD
jgi:hypothetical protein